MRYGVKIERVYKKNRALEGGIYCLMGGLGLFYKEGVCKYRFKK